MISFSFFQFFICFFEIQVKVVIVNQLHLTIHVELIICVLLKILKLG